LLAGLAFANEIWFDAGRVIRDRRTPWIEIWQASASPRFPSGQCGDHERLKYGRNAPQAVTFM
jgi:hypothetical protein